MTARFAGFFWMLTIVTGGAAMVLLQKIVVSGNPAATAANITAHSDTIRMGVAANLIATLCYVAATVFVYEILAPVNRSLSLLATFFSLLGCASSALGFFLNLAPLVILGNPQSVGALALEQLQATTFLLLRLRMQVEIISFAFFGLHCLLVGFVIVRATVMPRIVGALLMLGGLGWLTYSLANLLSPPLARALFPIILAPGILGEATLTLWLLTMGVKPHAQLRAEYAS